MARVTREDVARLANVSGSTVSRVLSGREDMQISADTRVRVIEAAERLGYLPNPAARALMTGQTQIVGLWMCLTYSRYRAQVIDHMRGILSRTDFAIAITDVEEDLFWRHSMARALRLAVDGIIAFDTPTAGDAFARTEKNQAGTTPFVGMGAYWSKSTSYVGVDLRPAVDEAMTHLISGGRKRIAYLQAKGGDTDEARSAGYGAAMRSTGLPELRVESSDLSLPGARTAVREFLKESPSVDAIFCFNDDMALGAYQALEELHLRPGKDVALIGCDGIEEVEYLACPITTIRQPVDEMCSLAWEFLRTRIADPGAPIQQRILTPQLIVRPSSQL